MYSCFLVHLFIFTLPHKISHDQDWQGHPCSWVDLGHCELKLATQVGHGRKKFLWWDQPKHGVDRHEMNVTIQQIR